MKVGMGPLQPLHGGRRQCHRDHVNRGNVCDVLTTLLLHGAGKEGGNVGVHCMLLRAMHVVHSSARLHGALHACTK